MSGMDENLELLRSDSLSLEMAKLKPEEVEARGVRERGRTELGSHGLGLVPFTPCHFLCRDEGEMCVI